MKLDQEDVERFLTPIEIGTVPTIVIAIGGLAVNIGSVFILQGGEMSLNEKGAFYHLLGDAGGSIAVIVSVVVVEVTGITVIDPIAAALIAGIVLWSAGKVLRGSGAIFFMKTPFQPEHVREDIEAVDGVDQIDDWHAWQICSQITVATAHVETSVETMSEADTVTQQIHHVLEEHGVDHATIELSPGYGDRRTHLNSHAH